MKKACLRVTVLLVLLLAWVATASAAEGKKGKQIILTPDDLQWKAGPPELPTAKVAVLEGDPAKKGFFVMRAQFPAGTKIPAHVHNNLERVTVISGKFNLAMGAKAENPIVLPAGSYFALPPKTLHNAWVDEDTVVQIATFGPWSMQVKQGKQKPAGAPEQE